jgi:hypothetical protein
LDLVKAQVTILTSVNDELENVLHLACELGNQELVNFICQNALEYGILKFIINGKCEMGRTPLFHLTLRGFKMKADLNVT